MMSAVNVDLKAGLVAVKWKLAGASRAGRGRKGDELEGDECELMLMPALQKVCASRMGAEV